MVLGITISHPITKLICLPLFCRAGSSADACRRGRLKAEILQTTDVTASRQDDPSIEDIDISH